MIVVAQCRMRSLSYHDHEGGPVWHPDVPRLRDPSGHSALTPIAVPLKNGLKSSPLNLLADAVSSAWVRAERGQGENRTGVAGWRAGRAGTGRMREHSERAEHGGGMDRHAAARSADGHSSGTGKHAAAQ